MLWELGFIPLPKLARQLGRTPRAIQERCKEKGIAALRATSQAHGLSTQQCAAALGVHRQRIQRWVGLGWLKAGRYTVIEREIIVVRREDLHAFLHAVGGLLEGLNPSPGWAETVERARIKLHARYIRRGGIAAIFCLPANTFGAAEWIAQSGFPAAAFHLQYNQTWYEKESIRAWLRTAHPRYRTRRALQAFGLEQR